MWGIQVLIDADFSEVLSEGALRAGPRGRFSALENRDTLRTFAAQRERTIEVHKSGRELGQGHASNAKMMVAQKGQKNLTNPQ